MSPSPTIDHVFVLMLENRSLDHMLGFSQLTGTDAETKQSTNLIGLQAGGYGNSFGGTTYPASTTAPLAMPVDPGHEFTDVWMQLTGLKWTTKGQPYPPVDNSGFVTNYAGQEKIGSNPLGDIMGCYAPDKLSVLNTLAKSFAVCDHWYSSMPGATWPNRFFLNAGSSGGLDHSPTTTELLEAYETSGYAFQHGTIFDALSKKKIPWRIYTGTPYPISYAVKGTRPWDWYNGHFVYYKSFASDVKATSWWSGKPTYAPKYTFIEPNYGKFISSYAGGVSQHPLDDVTRGEHMIKWTYEAIRNSPLWKKSLLIITWDEHGGFYDHVTPPTAFQPGDKPLSSANNRYGFDFSKYGVRVPAVIVSPLIPPNLIDHRQYDHTSVLATLRQLFGVPSLTYRDANALNLTPLLTADSPNDGPTTPLTPYASGIGTKPEPWDMWPPVSLATLIGLGSGTFAGKLLALFEGTDVLPTAGVAAEAMPDPTADTDALHGNMAGFLRVAMRRDLALTPPGERLRRLARFRRVKTVGDARQYLAEALPRLATTRASHVR